MKQLSLADIHCDTAYEIFKHSHSFFDNTEAVSLKKAEVYKDYLQVLAIWSDKALDNDSAYNRFFEIAEYLKKNISTLPKDIFSCGAHSVRLILSLEDARILNYDVSRLNALSESGVKIITPLWSGITCIGGAYDTDEGLSDFGVSVIKESLKKNIIPDISHASQRSARDIIRLAGTVSPVIASHSNSYSVYPHPRNLTDGQFKEIAELGGLVGINLCAEHLGVQEKEPPLETLMRHIEHYLELGGEDIICFGCDFDGAATPEGLQDITSLYSIAKEMLKRNFSYELIDKIFYSNAKNFISKYISVDK